MFVTNPTKSLYIKILTWAYEKEEPFLWETLREELNLNDNQMRRALTLFRNGSNGDRPLLSSFTENDRHYYELSDKGMSAAVDYLELKHAQKNGSLGVKIATIAILVSIIVGALQVYIGTAQLKLNLIEINKEHN